MGVSPLQLVNLHRNRRYFVIKLHTWFYLSYFLKTNIKFYCIYQYFMSINSFFNTISVSRYSRPITNETSHVTTHATHSDPWPTLAHSTSLLRLPNNVWRRIVFAPFLIIIIIIIIIILLFLSFFLSVDHELVHGRSQELLDRISWNLVELYIYVSSWS